MSWRLIINADDYNLTPGVTRGILKAHDQGIVTSTTVMINLPLVPGALRELKKRPRLGAGLHLNVTLGRPLNLPSRVPSLVKPDGHFRRPADYLKKAPSVRDLVREYTAQAVRFEELLGKKPDHLDTHHHLHDFPPFFRAIAAVAGRWNIPLRRSRIFQLAAYGGERDRLKTTDYLFGNLEARFIWKKEPFLGVAMNLPEGTSEIGCHPGFCDAKLREISSFREGREEELALFADKGLRGKLLDFGIDLTTFSEI